MSNILKDYLAFNDEVNRSHSKFEQSKGLWKKTKIIGGYGLHKNDMGISELDEVVFEKENMVPLIGVQYAMETIFGIKGELVIPTLNETMGIGAQGSSIQPSGGMPYPYGQKVCLFGVGTGGAAENNITVLDIGYHETGIADMVPFRYTNDALSNTDINKYYGKKIVDSTLAYYLKKFDNDPKIYHLYKNGEDGEDGSAIDSSYFVNGSEIGVESFVEMDLTISKKDVREWFNHNANIEQARVNTIALFTAIYDASKNDYANIQLFSKLNIPTEPLAITKDMSIIYRVYGA